MSIRFLDGLRGIAAAIVMVSHARLLLWEGYSSGFAQHPEQYSALDKIGMYVFSAFRYGHEMVILFFILSGFVIHLRFSNREKRAVMNLKIFWTRRIKRLYPPLLCALFLAFILDSIGRTYGWGIYEHQTAYPNINRDIASVINLPTLIGNLFFLMTVYVPPFGTTTVTWSLMYEWWFYVLYPFFYFGVLRFGFRKMTLGIAILFLLSFLKDSLPFLLFWKVMDSFIIWWMGACLAELWTNRENLVFPLQKMTFALLLCLPTPFILRGGILSNISPIVWDFILGLGFTGLVGVLLFTKPENIIIRFLNRLKPLGDCSYTLYLIHLTVFVFASGYLMSENGTLPQHHYYVAMGAVLISLLAYGLHFIIEKPFTGVNRMPYIKDVAHIELKK
jgi:peptidoglycan/LPS O-acetylase OafA/YrhL